VLFYPFETPSLIYFWLFYFQICYTLWMLTSYLSDGFADIGTMLGSKLLGSYKSDLIKPIFNKLAGMGIVFGALMGGGFFIFRDPVIHSFTTDVPAVELINTMWWLLCLMQAVNSAVFVYDGLLYATGEFWLVRNIMIIGCAVWFMPAVYYFNLTFHTFLALWVVKAVLNLWRCGTAVWLIHFRFYPLWALKESSTDKNTIGNYTVPETAGCLIKVTAA